MDRSAPARAARIIPPNHPLIHQIEDALCRIGVAHAVRGNWPRHFKIQAKQSHKTKKMHKKAALGKRLFSRKRVMNHFRDLKGSFA